MAVRLQMKLGVVAEQDRLDDSPDTIVVVEPSVGSVARSKGHLYLLVTSQQLGGRALESTRLVAETIRNEYYYDESGGIRVCLERAIRQANKKIGHQRDRFGLGHESSGPIGVGVAVVRGNELYVATVGPAEAYLIRQARLSTLPDPHRERGLPADELEPDVWRGEISVGDSLVLISPNVTARIGTDDLKDAMVTLHPQSAMEHLHHRFVAADGTGSDGAIAFEATEVAATQKQRALVPVRPAEPLAGAPERSPIPLAEPVAGGVAAVQAGASAARDAAGGALDRAVHRLQELLPRRRQAHRRVTPLSARRETQRRAAVAILAFVVVAVGLGMTVYIAGGGQPPGALLSSAQAGQKALDEARADINKVFGPGIDLVADDPRQALELLTDAQDKLGRAEQAGISAGTLRPLRDQVSGGLDRLFHVVEIADRALYRFKASDPARNLTALVRGPDGQAYVMDRMAKAVYRIDVRSRKLTLVLRAGTHGATGGTVATPKLLGVGGPDLLIVDSKNVVWRWRPANSAGRGTLVRVTVHGSASWGNHVTAIGTFVKNPSAGLYNLYVIDKSQQQILSYSPRADGGGYPIEANKWLDAARPVDKITSLYIDGDLYVADGGTIQRYRGGNGEGWEPKPPGDEVLREPPRYSVISSGSDWREGRLYGFDQANARIIALNKADGSYIEQYRLTGGNAALQGLRGLYVVPGADDKPATLYWIAADSLHTATLVAAPKRAAAPSPGAGKSPSPSLKATPKP
jgi:hypothetical protein